MYKILGLATLILTSTAMAEQRVRLDDGREVILNDNFTWQYINNASSAQAKSTALDKTQPATIPLIEKKVASLITLDSKRPSMQLSNSGVEVLLGSPSYAEGKLIIPTSITNQSLNSVILIEAEVEISTPDKQTLVKKSITIWQSIKRMPDTYLRPEQVEQGRSIELKVDKQEQYFVSANITNLVTR